MYGLIEIFDVKFEINSLQKKFDFEVRPNASNGVWIFFLLPTAIIVSAIKHYVVLTETYKSVVLLSVGIIFTSLLILRTFKTEIYTRVYQLWIFLPIISLFLYFSKGIVFAVYSGVFCTIIYSSLYYNLLKMFPKTFTLGEAALTSQAVTILLYTMLQHFHYLIGSETITTGTCSTIIIQVGLFGIMILGKFLYFFNIEKKAVYFWSLIILTFTVLLPLHILLRRSPVLWIVSLLVEDFATMKMILYWVICVCMATLAVIKQRNKGNKASSSQRKIFHILAVAVYVPGLMYECNLLYLGSGILLGVFLILEILRNFDVPPLGPLLQESFNALSDEKDSGILAVTPIYLLSGFTSPIWIHPAPCDVTDSAYFSFLPLVSGILSVGIGDTMASVFGTEYGKHFFNNSKKTYEGTVASIISQLLSIYLFYCIGFIGNMDELKIMRIIVAITFTSFVEAKTDQIDNAILPLIMYTILV